MGLPALGLRGGLATSRCSIQDGVEILCGRSSFSRHCQMRNMPWVYSTECLADINWSYCTPEASWISL